MCGATSEANPRGMSFTQTFIESEIAYRREQAESAAARSRTGRVRRPRGRVPDTRRRWRVAV